MAEPPKKPSAIAVLARHMRTIVRRLAALEARQTAGNAITNRVCTLETKVTALEHHLAMDARLARLEAALKREATP